jgi:hypothetical protein
MSLKTERSLVVRYIRSSTSKSDWLRIFTLSITVDESDVIIGFLVQICDKFDEPQLHPRRRHPPRFASTMQAPSAMRRHDTGQKIGAVGVTVDVLKRTRLILFSTLVFGAWSPIERSRPSLALSPHTDRHDESRAFNRVPIPDSHPLVSR